MTKQEIERKVEAIFEKHGLPNTLGTELFYDDVETVRAEDEEDAERLITLEMDYVKAEDAWEKEEDLEIPEPRANEFLDDLDDDDDCDDIDYEDEMFNLR